MRRLKSQFRFFIGMIVFVLLFSVSCTSFRAGVEGLEKGEIVIERSGNLVSMMINGGV